MSDLAAPGGSPERAYMTVADDIERHIRSGELKPGVRLRPERELADHYECSYTTIRRAMKELRDVRGLIVTRWGHGTYVKEGPTTDQDARPPDARIPPVAGGHAVGGHAVVNVIVKAGVAIGVWRHDWNWRLADWLLLAVFIVLGLLAAVLLIRRQRKDTRKPEEISAR